MEKTEKAPNTQDQDLIKIDVETVLENYTLAELKFQACENHLLGNFDKNKNYQILDIIYPELIHIEKILEERTSSYYTAYTTVEQTKLNFYVEFKKDTEETMTATLVLKEKIVFGKVFETIISTPIKTITDLDTPDFPYKVRSAFHLVNKDDVDEKDFFENYVSPPIELVTELLKKSELYEILKYNREKYEKEYMSLMLQELKTTPEGTIIAKKFFSIVKDNKLHEITENRVRTFKEVLDNLIDEQIEHGLFSKEQILHIAQIRDQFNENTKKEAYEYMQTKTKSGFKGFIGVKKNLSKDLAPQPPVKTEDKQPQKEEVKPPKPEPKPEQKAEQEHKEAPKPKPEPIKIEFEFPKPKLRINPKPSRKPQPKPRPAPKPINLNRTILERANMDGPIYNPPTPFKEVDYEVYKESIASALIENYGTHGVKVSYEIHEYHYEAERTL